MGAIRQPRQMWSRCVFCLTGYREKNVERPVPVPSSASGKNSRSSVTQTEGKLWPTFKDCVARE